MQQKETLRQLTKGYSWAWHFAGNDPNAFAIFGKPNLLVGKNEASGDVIRVCDYTHVRDFAIVKFNDERPARVETDLDSTSGLTALEYFVDCAVRGQGRVSGQAEAIFTRFWTETVAFKPIANEEAHLDGEETVF